MGQTDTKTPSADGQGQARDRATAYAILLVLTGAALAIRLVGLGTKPFWSSEVHEIFNARCTDFLNDLEESGSDILGYFWQHLVWRIGFADLEFWSRLPSAVAGACAVPVAYAWSRLAATRPASLLAAAFITVSVYLVDASQTARWYMPAALAQSIALLLLIRILIRDGSPRLRVLVVAWLANSVAILSHSMNLVLLLTQAGIILVSSWRVILKGDSRVRLAWVLRWLKWFVPLVPAVILQLYVMSEFSAKLRLHDSVFVIDSTYSVVALIQSILAVFAGSQPVIMYIFMAILFFGGLFMVATDANLANKIIISLLSPVVVLSAMVLIISNNAFNSAFLAYAMGPVAALAASFVFSLSKLLARRLARATAAALASLPVLFLIGMNSIAVGRYLDAPTKPMLGADMKAAAAVLADLQLSREDTLVYRYEEQFTHLAFYAAYELQKPRLVAQWLPDMGRDKMLGYLHRYNGCSDRPRIWFKSVQTLSEAGQSAKPIAGRTVLLVTCPVSYTAPGEEPAAFEPDQMSDVAAWLLSGGHIRYLCGPTMELLSSWEFKVELNGVVVAWTRSLPQEPASWSKHMAELLSTIPATPLRVKVRHTGNLN